MFSMFDDLIISRELHFEMPFTIEYNKDKDYYHVSHIGEDSPGEYEQSTDDLIKKVGLQAQIKLLVNLYDVQKTSMNKQEQFDLSNKITSGAFSKMKIAFVMPKELDNQNDWYFIVEICNNSGVHIKPFYLEGKALAWLLD